MTDLLILIAYLALTYIKKNFYFTIINVQNTLICTKKTLQFLFFHLVI